MTYIPDARYDADWTEPAACVGPPPTPPDPTCVLKYRDFFDQRMAQVDVQDSSAVASILADYQTTLRDAGASDADKAAARSKRDADLAAQAVTRGKNEDWASDKAAEEIAANCCP